MRPEDLLLLFALTPDQQIQVVMLSFAVVVFLNLFSVSGWFLYAWLVDVLDKYLFHRRYRRLVALVKREVNLGRRGN